MTISEDQRGRDTHYGTVLGDHHGADTHKVGVPGDQDSVVTQDNGVPGDRAYHDTQTDCVLGDHGCLDTHGCAVPEDHGGCASQAVSVLGDQATSVTQHRRVSEDYDFLMILADTVQDLEDARKAAENRIRSLTHEIVEGERGGFFGKALSPEHDVVVSLQRIIDDLRVVEKGAIRNLERAMKRHPLYAWVEEQRGLGLKTIGRLLGLLGDPAWHAREDRPRTVGELFAYAGVAGPGQRRTKGRKLTYDPRIKPKLHVIVDGLVKAGIRDGEPVTPWGELYYARKAYYAAQPACEVCKKSQHDHDSHDPLAHCTPAHIDNKARRVLMREVLRGLWTVAREVDVIESNV